MARSRWNWLTYLHRRLNAKLSIAPPPSKLARRPPLYGRAGIVEALEPRLQLSSASIVAGYLSIEVTGNDRVQVSASQGQAVVKFNGRTAEIGSVVAAEVTEIVVTANANSSGNNAIDLSHVTRSRFPSLAGTAVFGGSGDDTIRGSAFADQLDGGAGRDFLIGNRGRDVLIGGEDNDRLSGGYGSDTLDGGNGSDRLNAGTGANMIYCDETADSVFGASQRDTMLPEPSNSTDGSVEANFAALVMPPMIPMLTLMTVSGYEGNGILNVGVSLTSTISTPITVNYTSGSGTALAGIDFTGGSGSFIIPANTFTATIALLNFIVNDTLVEGFESFVFQLTSAIGAMVNTTTTSAMLMDDDFATGGGGGGGLPPLPPPPINNLPTISAIGAQNFDEDSSLVLNITVGDIETPVGMLALSVDPMTNIVLFPNITITTPLLFPATRIVTITPALNAAGTGNVSLKVTDTNGGTFVRTFQVTVNPINDPPIITNTVNQTTAEGAPVIWLINVTDPDIGDTWVITSIIGLPNGLVAYPGGISGAPHYDTAGVHAVTVTVADTAGDGLLAVSTFNWTVTDRSFTSLTGRELPNFVAISPTNQLTVTSVTLDALYVQKNNSVRLSLSGSGGIPLPDLDDVYYQVGPLGGPVVFQGNFLGVDPTILTTQNDWVVNVGLDVNLNGFMASEITHRFLLKVINFDDAKIQANRNKTNGPDPYALNESSFPIKADEIFDTDSRFSVNLVGGVYSSTTPILHEVYYGTAIQTAYSGSGTAFNFSPAGDSNSAMVRFYSDANATGSYNPGEPNIVTPLYKVKQPKVLNFKIDMFNAVASTPDFVGLTPTQILARVQDAVDAGVKRLRMKDSEDDFRAAVRITVSAAAILVFPADATHIDLPANAMDESTNFTSMSDDNTIRFISGWDPASTLAGKKGETQLPANKCLIAWPSMAVDTIVHEIGHTVLGPTHFIGDTMNIMTAGALTGGRDPAANKLTSGQADTYSGLP